MFDHVTIRVGDREASEPFYEIVPSALGRERTYSGEDLAEWDEFSLAAATDDHPVTRGLHERRARQPQPRGVNSTGRSLP